MPRAQSLNLTDKLAADGTLRWDVPAGDWVILRTGMTPTGTRNAPASPEGQGLEVDKMNRAAAQAHFDAFIGKLLQRMPAADRKAFKHVVADSYEMGSQNWTDGFAETLPQALRLRSAAVAAGADGPRRRQRGPVGPLPVGPAAAGGGPRCHAITSAGCATLCHPHGLQLWLENYGHWGFPAEFLQYGGQSDAVGGEFWATGDLGSIELRCASSAAHTYGKPIVSAEAFTGGPCCSRRTPSVAQARGATGRSDEGINHFVLHVYIHQPWDDRRPGVNAWFGTEFNRHNTWFEQGRAWIDYCRRC